LHDALKERALIRTLGPGDFVHLEGDPAESVSAVLDGQLLVEAYPESSWEPVVIGVYGRGALIGVEALGAGERRRTSTVRAATNAQLATISRREVRDFAQHSSEGRELIADLLLDSLDAARSALLANAGGGVEIRLARWLLYCDDATGNSNGNGKMPVAITQQDLASLAGTRRPTVNKVLGEMRARAMIDVGRGRVTVTDRKRLVEWIAASAGDD